MEGITIKNLSKNYSNKNIYENFSIDIEKNKILTILGESGSGKTTLLNAISGLTTFSGEILSEGVISYNFQEDRLIANLTVKENLELFLKGQNVDNLLEMFGLKEKANSFIKNMSAGEKRRVALLRALFFPSDILLLDEPLINLDLKLKLEIIDLIKKEQIKKPRTVVFVTHDIIEASNLSDRIILLKNGKIELDLTADKSPKIVAEQLYAFLTKN